MRIKISACHNDSAYVEKGHTDFLFYTESIPGTPTLDIVSTEYICIKYNYNILDWVWYGAS